MKLIKCRKCGATIMTDETLLSTMQEEYNALVKKSHRAKGADKQIIAQQLKHISKMMTAVCHNTAEAETRKSEAYNNLHLLRRYLLDNGLVDTATLDRIRDEARAMTKKKAAEDEKAIAEIYGGFENILCNNTKGDPTATKAINNIR